MLTDFKNFKYATAGYIFFEANIKSQNDNSTNTTNPERRKKSSQKQTNVQIQLQ